MRELARAREAAVAEDADAAGAAAAEVAAE
jgi:hypothetical protein